MNSKFLDFIFGYESSDKDFKESRIAEAEKHFSDKIISGIGAKYSKKIIDTPFSKFISRLRHSIAHASVKSYGVILLAFGLMTLLMNFAEYYFKSLPTSPTAELITGAVITVIALPLLFFDAPLSDSLQKWKPTSIIFFDVLCLRRTRVSADTGREYSSIIPIIIGVLFASLGFIISLPIVIIAVFSLVFLTLSVSSPEFALMITLLILPVIPILPHSTLIITLLVVVTALSFVGKVVLGKRLFHFEQYDAVLLLFMLFTLISGVFNKGLDSFEKSLVLIVVALAYTLVSNIIVNRRLAENAVKVIIFSSVPTAIYGIILYFISPAHPEWFDPTFADMVTSRAYATFGNPNIYAVFLTVTTIFSLAFTLDRAHKVYAPLYIIAVILNLTALILTWSRGAWIAVALSVLAFAIIRSRRAPKLLLIPAVLLPLVILLIPPEIITRVLSIFNLEDTSVSSRFSIWRSSLRMFASNIFIGVGVGEGAFTEEFLKYAEDSVTAPHSHNLFLEIGCEVGIFALLLFVFLLLIRVRHRASYAKYVRSSSVDNLCTTSGAAFFALLVFGMTDYIWYSSSMYFLFWVVFGIGSATLRISKKEYDDSEIYESPEKDETAASINIVIENR